MGVYPLQVFRSFPLLSEAATGRALDEPEVRQGSCARLADWQAGQLQDFSACKLSACGDWVRKMSGISGYFLCYAGAVAGPQCKDITVLLHASNQFILHRLGLAG